MAFQPVPDTVQAIMEYGFATELWTNTLHFERSGFTQSDVEQLGDTLLNWSESFIMLQMADFVSLNKVTLYGLNSVTDVKVTRTPATTVTGNRPGEPSPISDALVVTFRTGIRGRSGRGRNYVTGFQDPDINVNSVLPAYADAIEAAYNGLIADVGAIGWTWVVVSRVQAGAPLAQGAKYPVQSAEVRSYLLGSQSRRIPRG